MRDKSYRSYPIGQEAGRYLRRKRGSITASTYRDYESCLDKLARFYPDLEPGAFEPPAGRELVEEFLEHFWGAGAPRTYNKNLSITKDFFGDLVDREVLHGDPARKIKPHKKRDVRREKFSEPLIVQILEHGPSLQYLYQDRVALRLLLRYGLRKGAIGNLRYEHFDVHRRILTVFTKGEKVRELSVVSDAFWDDFAALRAERDPHPDHFVMCRRRHIWRGYGPDGGSKFEIKLYPAEPMGAHGLHDWWYACLIRAGIVSPGTTRGKKMHMARYTAGQRLLDETHDMKLVQNLLMHEDPSTTLEHYVDYTTTEVGEHMKGVDL